MLVSHLKKFIYLKTKKTGGTSVEIFLEPYCRNDGGTPEHYGPAIVSDAGIVGYRGLDLRGQTWWNHMPGTQVRHLIGEDIWSRYHKFCIVRNPFDRLVSHWWMRVPSQLRPKVSGDIGFARAEFSNWIETSPDLPTDRDIYLVSGRPCTDRILRYETLQEDLATLCQDLRIDADPGTMGRYKGEFRARPESYHAYYSPAARATVEKKYAFEIGEFGYSFE